MIENNDTDEGGQTKHHPTRRPTTNAKTRHQQQQQHQHHQDKEQTTVSGTNGVETTRSKIGGNNNNNNNNRCITCFRLLRDWRGNQLAKYYETKSNLTDLLDKDNKGISSRNLVVAENDASSRVLELIKTYLISSSSSANSSSRNTNNTRYVRNLLSNLNSISCSPKVCHSCFDCLNQIDNHMQHVQTLCSSMRARLDKSCRLIKNGQSNASRSKRLISRRKRRVGKKNTATVSLYNKLSRNMSDLNGWSYQNSALSSSLVYLPKHINRKLTVCVDTDRSDLENGSMTSSLISPPLRKYAMIDANDFELQRDQSKTSKSSEDNCLDHSSDKNFLSPNSSTNRRKRKSGNPSRFSHTLLHADVNNSANIHQSKENNLQQLNNKQSSIGSESIISPAEYASYSTKTTTNNNNVNNKVMNLRYRNANNATQAVQQQQRTTNGKVVTKKLLTNNTLNADNNNNDYDEQQLLMQNRINMMKRNLDQINSNKSRLVVASKDRHELDLDAVHTNHRSNKENDNSSENFEVYHINNGNDEMEEEENGTEYDDDGNMMYLKVKDDNEHHHNHHNHHNHNHSSGEIDEEAVEAASDFEEDEESKFCEIDDDLAAGFEYENDENLEEQETEEQSFDIMQDGGVGGIYEEEDEDVDEYDEEEDDDEDNDETFQIKGSTAKGHAPPKLTKHLNHLTDVEKRKGVNSRSKGDLLSGDGLIKNFISSALTNAVQSGGKHSSSHGGDVLYTKHTCNICKKSFKTQNILRQHMRIHTGDKPFVCDICQKAFSQMASLKYHLATHSDDRPFKCEDCSKTFKLKPPFKKHIKECPQRLIKLEKAEPSGSSSSISSKKPSAVVSSSSSISSSSPLYFKTGIK